MVELWFGRGPELELRCELGFEFEFEPGVERELEVGPGRAGPSQVRSRAESRGKNRQEARVGPGIQSGVEEPEGFVLGSDFSMSAGGVSFGCFVWSVYK